MTAIYVEEKFKAFGELKDKTPEERQIVKEADEESKNKVDLGCGEDKPEDWFGVDIVDTGAVDRVQDLDEEGWDLTSNTFDEVRASDVFEHLENPVNFLEEVHRIAKHGAKVWIKSPHISSQNWVDPTHKRLVGFQTIQHYFTEDGKYSYYSPCNFEVEKSRIVFPKRKIFFYNYLIEPLVNFSSFTKMIYENTFLSRFFPSDDVVFELEVVKD